ncbi:MAG: transcriptional repressor LexA [Clostridiales Family XIII bacterium]|jgi:repressor LexA|nr:transcriptional repressor LexA [Clostridiales Family XIII bacterium]
MEPLKKREQDILEFIQRETSRKGYPPTVREICSALNIKSTSTVHKDIERLEQKGYLKKDPSKPRALMLRRNPQAGGDVAKDRIDVVDVPIVGRIAAGSPILAEENVENYIPVPASYVQGTNFMLSVHGDSMVDAGIFDGDLILVKQQETANNGEIVVAMIDGFESEATVKTYYREEGHVRLQPENSEMSPIIVNDVSILGLVKGVFRFFN